ncbi:DNA polymerase III subunit alpha [Ilyomonas limi]|uniref:DNA-directed DNA polymerase n=1 Tax=Ilyomonas limi TaxID=2575867 RepID=A0A4U3KSI2_9BACT|nr:DNA polymerase III subunit alpha [Ilyomonas limi]TKK65425.1 DNA polymerase III subunit alpha [Ilyomonas limi]
MYLNCKTYYSLRFGTFSTEELVNTAVDKGVSTLALTNINGTYDEWEFYKLCLEAGIKPILGAELRNNDKLLCILLAANNYGLTCIHEFLSEHIIPNKPFPETSEKRRVFTNCSDGFIIYPLGAKPLDELLVNEYIGILPWETTKLITLDWKNHKDKLVVRQPVTFQNKTYFNLHRLLRAISKNCLLSKLPVEAQASDKETFVPPATILQAFKDYPFIIVNTYKLMEACNISIDFEEDKNKKCFSATKEDDRVLLYKLAHDGFVRRYGRHNKAALERFEKELKIINDLGFNAYFLINNDIVQYANGRGFYHVGRGSGANSIVAYCLGITDVDPLELNLYFERFLNPERTSPPDFDIDFSYADRDEIMDYIFKRFGRDHVAICGSYSTFKHDAAIHELGKVFGLPEEEIKALQRAINPEDKIQKLVLQYANLLKGFPNIMSIHPCGMLITEERINTYTTSFLPPKGFTGVQMDMFIAEDIGINKFDILSQRGLGHIKECLQLVKKNKGVDVNIHDFATFRNDERIKTQIRDANTIGCFYIESPAMRQLLKKLRCDDYITLVAASSIIRPGVASSGMMREYIYRYHNRDKIQYIHPLFKEHLSETFGVMVFQEDVIKIAHYFAGLSLGEADILRRAMSGKYRNHNRFHLMKAKFLDNCKAIGHPDELANEVWRQMVSFAGYSFNKAHSASFAVESYMSLYLKTHYPKEFMVAVINNFGGFYSRELYFIELLKCGGEIGAPCVNCSYEYTNISGNEVYVGFIHIKGLQTKLVETIIEERTSNGPYLHLQDFIERTNIGLEQLNTLISVGAFRFTGKSKKRLLWEANFLQKKNVPELHKGTPLFGDEPLEFTLPELIDNPLDDLYDQLEILGFTLTNPFELVAEDADKYISAKDLKDNVGKMVTCIAYFIAHKHAVTKNNDMMYFGSFLDKNLDWIDTVHFPDIAAKYPIHNSGFYKITGKVTEDFGVHSIEVYTMFKVGYKNRSYVNLG